jgi:hypothetical protein
MHHVNNDISYVFAVINVNWTFVKGEWGGKGLTMVYIKPIQVAWRICVLSMTAYWMIHNDLITQRGCIILIMYWWMWNSRIWHVSLLMVLNLACTPWWLHGCAETCGSKVTTASHIVSIFSWCLSENKTRVLTSCTNFFWHSSWAICDILWPI